MSEDFIEVENLDGEIQESWEDGKRIGTLPDGRRVQLPESGPVPKLARIVERVENV